MPWPRYSMKHIIMEQHLKPSLWIEMLRGSSKARLGATTRANARPGRLPRRPDPHARGRVPPGLDRWDLGFVISRASKPGVCSRQALDSADGFRRQRTKIRRRCQQASNSSSLPNSRFTQIQVLSYPCLRKSNTLTSYELIGRVHRSVQCGGSALRLNAALSHQLWDRLDFAATRA